MNPFFRIDYLFSCFPLVQIRKKNLLNYLVIINFIPDNDEKIRSVKLFPMNILNILPKLLRGKRVSVQTFKGDKSCKK